MIIEGTNNQSVEIKIINYQFPDIAYNIYDSNWLNIYLNVKSNLGNWQTIDPSLLTKEVQDLIFWFENLARNEKPKWLDQEFTEPNLAFYLLNSHKSAIKKIKIVFSLESRPNPADDSKEYFVEFHASNSKLIEIANEFRYELAKYPER
jgi:hypothetical protein